MSDPRDDPMSWRAATMVAAVGLLLLGIWNENTAAAIAGAVFYLTSVYPPRR